MTRVQTRRLEPGDDPTVFLSHPDALYEVVDGQVVELPPTGIFSICIASELHFALRLFLERNRLGRVVTEGLLIFDSERDLRRRPDVAFVSIERWAANREMPEEGDWEVVPDLAIEVVSPNDTAKQVTGKVGEYFHYGVRQVWIVRPLDKTIYVYTSPTLVRILGAQDELDGSDVLPGFRLPVGPLFKRTID